MVASDLGIEERPWKWPGVGARRASGVARRQQSPVRTEERFEVGRLGGG